MQDLNDKVTGSSLAASEWNQVPSELQNVITALNQSLTAADLNQLGKAIAGYSGSGNAFVDGGTANAIVLSPVTGLQAPPQYTNLQAVRFIKNGTNTGAVTVNVAGLGVLNVLDQFGAALASGDLQNGSRYTIEYSLTIDGGSPGFVLEKASGLANDLPRGYLDGFILSNNTIDSSNDIDIAAGSAKDSTNSADLNLSSALGKQIDVAWAEGGTPGAPSGGFPSLLTGGSPVNDTWYRVFVILKNTGQVDAGFDTSANAVNLLADATDYSEFRQVGWIRYGTAQIEPFFQDGDRFRWVTAFVDFNASNPGTSVIPVTGTVPPNTIGNFYFNCSDEAATGGTGYFIRANDETILSGVSDLATQGGSEGAQLIKNVNVDASSGLQIRSTRTNATLAMTVAARGWIDLRGKA